MARLRSIYYAVITDRSGEILRVDIESAKSESLKESVLVSKRTNDLSPFIFISVNDGLDQADTTGALLENIRLALKEPIQF